MKLLRFIPSIHPFEVDSKTAASQENPIDNRQRALPFLNYRRLSWLCLILLTALSPLQAYAGPPIKVTYNGNGANGGSVPVDSTSYTSGDTVTVLPPGSLTRSGHLFSHWDTASNDSGADYDPGNTFSITSSVTLYAQWKPIDPATPTGVMPLSGGTKWALCFSDEFNGASLNTNKWNVDVSTQSRNPRPSQGIADWWWKSANVTMDGSGYVELHTTKFDSDTMHCGSISSDGLYEPKYGYLEARIQIADTRKSTHTAFWLQGPNMNNSDPADGTANDGAEVDIFESAWFGDYTKSVVHIDGYDTDHRANTQQYSTPNLHSGYHVFGLEWTAGSMKIYYDGVLKVTYTGIWVPQVAEWLWLSTGASFGDVGTFASEPIGLLTSAKVDYVRVWEPVPNVAPVFASDPISGANATENAAYSGTLAGLASDANNDPLTFAKVSGPTWLSVAANGSLSGTPTNSNVGVNSFTVSVSDGIAAAVQAQLSISVSSAPATYLVTYHSNNAASGTAPSNQTKVHNVTLPLAFNTGTLARTGYTFAGWNIQADGLGTSYAEGASYTANAAVTLYAKWTMLPYTSWASSNGLAGGNAVFGANPDGDSLTNLQEFAYGMDPNSPALTRLTYTTDGPANPGLPILENIGTTQSPNYRVVFLRRKDYQAAGLTYTVECGANLTYWKTNQENLSVVSGTSVSAVEAVAVPFPLTVPLSGDVGSAEAPPKFFRVGVSSN